MYGITAKRFDADFYKKNPTIKNLDFVAGFLTTGLFCFLFFKPIWFVVPLFVFVSAMMGIFLKIKRRYVIYGALSLIFFPLVMWGGLMILYAGRNEIKS